MTVRWTVRADGDQGAQFAPRPSPIRVAILICGFSSFGRAPPCQCGGGGFEPRNPLQKKKQTERSAFCFIQSFPGRITGQCSGKPSHFALKTFLKRFLHERHNPLQKKKQTERSAFCFIQSFPGRITGQCSSKNSLRQKQHLVVFCMLAP